MSASEPDQTSGEKPVNPTESRSGEPGNKGDDKSKKDKETKDPNTLTP